MIPVIIYLVTINVLAFILMLADKKKSIKRKRRIPENTFIVFAVIGGSLGVMAAMDILRHKTRHSKFTIGVPLILAFQVVIVYFVYYFL